MALGASELIQEVSEGKITGEEDRYSKTDLWDFAANVEGAEQIIELLEPALEKADPELLGRIETGFDALDGEPRGAAQGRRLRPLLPGGRRLPGAGPVPPDDGDPGPDRHA